MAQPFADMSRRQWRVGGAQLAQLNEIRAHNRPPLREINLNGDRAELVQVDNTPDDIRDLEMLDNAAEDLFRDNDIPEPMNDAPPVNDLREVYTTPYGRNAGEPIDNEKRPTLFERLANTYLLDEAAGEFGPFKSEKEWEFAEWWY